MRIWEPGTAADGGALKVHDCIRALLKKAVSELESVNCATDTIRLRKCATCRNALQRCLAQRQRHCLLRAR
jgi:hypothetical protein